MRAQVLIIEGDAKAAALLALHLESAGFAVQAAASAAQALALFAREAFAFVIVNLSLPDMGGHALIKGLRGESGVPLLALSDGASESDVILALDLGADDVMQKPLNPLELVARVKAHLRRCQRMAACPAAAQQLRAGALLLDCAALSLQKDGRPIPITLAEYKILHRLMRAPGAVFTKRQLYACISLGSPESGRDTAASDENTIMVHISKIREKIEDEPRSPRYIKTVRGRGYRFEAPAAP